LQPSSMRVISTSLYAVPVAPLDVPSTSQWLLGLQGRGGRDFRWAPNAVCVPMMSFRTYIEFFLRALICKNLDDLFSPPVTAGKCNAFGGERIVANLRSLQLPEDAADQMITSSAARMDISETHILRFETRKNERETFPVQRESLSPKLKSCIGEAAPQALGPVYIVLDACIEP